MTLPSNVDRGTVVGYFEDVLGNALVGTVIFTPQFTDARDTTTTPKTIILPSPVTVTLSQGAFTVDLVATDDVDLNLTPWTYLVTPRFTGPGTKPPTMTAFNIPVPANTTTDLADAAPVAVQDGVQITRGPGVAQGGTTGQVLAKASDADYDTEWIDAPTGGSGGTALTSYATQVETLSDYPASFPSTVADVSGLQADLDAKQPSGDYATNAALASGLAGKQNVGNYLLATGTAAAATKLATARTINGVNFDGTANITVTDGTKLPIETGAPVGRFRGFLTADPDSATLVTGDWWFIVSAS